MTYAPESFRRPAMPGREQRSKICVQLNTWLGKSDHLVQPDHVLVRGRTFWDADILIADTKPITIEDLDRRGPYLRGIVRPGVGYDNVPLEECRRRGIVCAYTPNAPSQAVAEWALGMIVAALRKFQPACSSIKWARYASILDGIAPISAPRQWRRYMGRSLSEISVGIVGLGRIGKRLAAMLSPLVGRIYGCDPVNDSTFDEINRIDRVDLQTLLSMSDVVSLHVPLDQSTVGMIGRHELTLMPKSGIILNCSRGGIIQEDALSRHLTENPAFTACVDVYSAEPYAGTLADCPNAILTAHMAAMTIAARDRMEREGIRAALSILKGESPRWSIPHVGADDSANQCGH